MSSGRRDRDPLPADRAREKTAEGRVDLDARLRSPAPPPPPRDSPLLDLQRTAGNHATRLALGVESAVAAIRRQDGSGDALDPNIRDSAEQSHDRDLGDVRVHADPAARVLAQRFGARAFTVGRNVWLGPGESRHDGTLLAHELAHVVQQSRGPVAGTPLGPDLRISDPADPFERSADRAGLAASGPRPGARPSHVGRSDRGRLPSRPSHGPLTIQRATAAASPKRHTFTPEEEAAMTADVERIVAILRSKWVSEEEEKVIVGLLTNWRSQDKRLATGQTPYLDRFLLLLKKRTFARSPATTPWVDLWSSAYDELWYRLEDEQREQFIYLLNYSRQATSGPVTPQGEGFWKHLGKQELIGMWGMLKGMGVGLASVGDDVKWALVKEFQAHGIPVKDPGSLADLIADQFDQSGDIMWGKEYTEGEELFLGLTAKDVGTAGGGLIWQLVMLGKGGGTASKVLGFISSMHGIETSAQEIANLIAEMQEKEGKLDAAKLASDPRFYKALTQLAASIVSAMMAGSSPKASAAAKAASSRIALLLDAAQLAPMLGQLVEIWTSDAPTAEKKKRTGPVILDIMSRIVTLGFSLKTHIEEHGKAPKDKGRQGEPPAEEKGAGKKGTSAEQEASKPKDVAKPKEEVKPKPRRKQKVKADAAAKTAPEAGGKVEGTPKAEPVAQPLVKADLDRRAEAVIAQKAAAAETVTGKEAPAAETKVDPAEVIKPLADAADKVAAAQPSKVEEATLKVTAEPVPKIEPKVSTTAEPPPVAQVEPPAVKVEPAPVAKVEPAPTPEAEVAPKVKAEAEPVKKAAVAEETEGVTAAKKAEATAEATKAVAGEQVAAATAEPKTYKYKRYSEIPLESIPPEARARLKKAFKRYNKKAFKNEEDYIRYRYGQEQELIPPPVKRPAFQVEQAAGRVAEEFWSSISGELHNSGELVPKVQFETEFGVVEPDFIPPKGGKRVEVEGKVAPATRPEDALLIADTKILSSRTVDPATGKETWEPRSISFENPVKERQLKGFIEVAAKTQSKTLVLIGQTGVSVHPDVVKYAASKGVEVKTLEMVTPSGHKIKG